MVGHRRSAVVLRLRPATVRETSRGRNERERAKRCRRLASAPPRPPSGTIDLASIVDEYGKELDAPIREQELQAHLERALGELGAEDRLIVKLRFEDGLTAREIANLIGLSTQFHVYRRLSAITDSLRQRLAERGVDGSAP